MKMELDFTQKKSVEVDDINIDYTKRILSALRAKAKEYNDSHTGKVSIDQLKSVFARGAAEQSESLLLSGFARVNMYLRFLDPATVAKEFKQASNNKNFKKLIFDFSSHLTPNEGDYSLASEDLNKHNLNFNFTSIDELYLEDVHSASFYKNYI